MSVFPTEIITATYIDGSFQIAVHFGKTCNFSAGLLYDGYIICGSFTLDGSLFVLHNLFWKWIIMQSKAPENYQGLRNLPKV